MLPLPTHLQPMPIVFDDLPVWIIVGYIHTGQREVSFQMFPKNVA